ncbi:hypothetical protein QE367_003029 [Microbacterium paludicola]|uniref:Uncharacterized protein n=1 Tax=Microbacterium paludicola TaxID=300019 RepID=A0ABU1I520_9MICO|nr:hypothetical protein [Microbacterium paludicola]MDR6168825.1 hypothetical protein [Microbacterium paludicola]
MLAAAGKVDAHRDGEELPESLGQLDRRGGAEEIALSWARPQVHARADREIIGNRPHRECAVGVALPFDGGAAARAPRSDDDRLGHHEARQQPDAELPQEVAPGEVEDVALRAAPDGREQVGHL